MMISLLNGCDNGMSVVIMCASVESAIVRYEKIFEVMTRSSFRIRRINLPHTGVSITTVFSLTFFKSRVRLYVYLGNGLAYYLTFNSAKST